MDENQKRVARIIAAFKALGAKEDLIQALEKELEAIIGDLAKLELIKEIMKVDFIRVSEKGEEDA